MRYAGLLVLPLAACGPTHSVDWYSKHPVEAAAVENRCFMHAQSGPDCGAAIGGGRKASDERLKHFRQGFQ